MLRFFFILLLCKATLSAQAVDPTLHTVIATSGINLRAAASTSAEVLTAIPFGERVNVFDLCEYSRDTIGKMSDYYRMHGHLQDAASEAVVEGSWIQVTYGADTGFVFNAYLWHDFGITELYNYNTGQPLDYDLIYPGAGCGAILYDPNALNFYGVYGAAETDLAVRRIEISYRTYDGDFGTSLLLTTEDSQHLRFIIVSRKALPAHEFAGSYFDVPAHYHIHADIYAQDEEHEHRSLPDFIRLDTMHTHYHQKQNYGNRDTIIVHTRAYISEASLEMRGTKYTLFDRGIYYNFSLEGKGDLNGDGYPDYLIGLSSEMTSYVRLYFSTPDGKSIKMVAETAFSCCC